VIREVDEKMTDAEVAKPGDLAELVDRKGLRFIFRLTAGGRFESNRGVVAHDEIIGSAWGSTVSSHLGSPFRMLRPTLSDYLLEFGRATQVMYPKDIAYALFELGVGPGKRVVEAGTGSGALTCALSYQVGATGRVFSYEVKPDVQRLAEKNLAGFDLGKNVELKLRDIAFGFDERGVDVVYLDLPNPWDYLEQVEAALSLGGAFGCLLPTSNQVIRLLADMRGTSLGQARVEEILLRTYQADADKFRPIDRMVGHTGYLIFAKRFVAKDVNQRNEETGG
jgi:tRNA (adenine57-N1/adenine58-N1)-methyltransferase